MIVNHTHQFIFVHVPKAAGTSVSELFSKYSSYSDLEVGGTDLGEAMQQAYKRRFGLTKHSTASEIRAVVGEDAWKRYYSFAFVRDPYARAQSTFHFMKRWHGNKEMKNLDVMDRFPDFRSFVMSDFFQEQKAHRLLWPQVKWLEDEQGRSLVDFVGRMESLDEDIHHVLSSAPGLVKIKAAPEAAPTKNRSARTDVALWDLLAGDAEVERRIFDAYRVDFERYGYSRFDAAKMPRPEEPAEPVVDPQSKEAREARGLGKPGKQGKAGKPGPGGDAQARKEGKAGKEGKPGKGGKGPGAGANLTPEEKAARRAAKQARLAKAASEVA